MPLIITIKVVPNSGKNMWVLDKNGILKCYVKSAAQKGKANKELMSFLSKSLKVPRNDIEIVAGATARIKRIKLSIEITFADVLQRLGIDKYVIQNKLF